MSDALVQRVRAAHHRAAAALLSEVGPEGHWVGELSSSALSTATAVTALTQVDAPGYGGLIRGGLEWLARTANPDGGWGDTVRSRSNLSTTSLVWAAFGAAGADARFPRAVDGATGYLQRQAGDLSRLVPAIEALYGADRTFSVPITMTLTLSGRLGADGWRRVRPLPFELAALPRGLFGALRLPVVSYALPALIAIGQVIHRRSGRFHPLRDLLGEHTLNVLTGLQPVNGGFLEATPLTSFVTMSLAAMGRTEHQVTRRGAAFLAASVRPDGSWPIDTNLATWGTTLALKALLGGGRDDPGHTAVPVDGRGRLLEWLLGQQYREVHPYTGAAPGGWAWTDLPGGVPDADDTAGALLALAALAPDDPRVRRAAADGVRWLMGLQNRDGGIPTFCRGWGTLPFDRSTPELTAHALRAWEAWAPHLPGVEGPLTRARNRAWAYLRRSQRTDGSWEPLWFGNEAARGQQNPVYGTAQVLLAWDGAAGSWGKDDPARRRARQFLVSAQNPDGGWGGEGGLPSTVEETAVAVRALAPGDPDGGAADRGADWLAERWEAGMPPAAPIGLYFARLWYFERLYPLVFSVDAFRRWRSCR